MTAGEYCNREVIVTEQDASVTEAAELMRRHHVGDLVVVKKVGEYSLPLGIITDRDIVIEVVAQGVDPALLAIKDIMSTRLVTVDEKVTLLDALEQMQSRGVRRLIVLEQGHLQGLLSADDAIELIAEAMNKLTRLVKREINHEVNEYP
ncbi:MAG: CBS domain-containing protein [Gammaproteobacteria bacterium]|nr:CBS domain-containing protein [Gammaproteobacteria bacterium]